jgi:hypothetical protein
MAETYQHGESWDEGSESIEGNHLVKGLVERVVSDEVIVVEATVLYLKVDVVVLGEMVLRPNACDICSTSRNFC